MKVYLEKQKKWLSQRPIILWWIFPTKELLGKYWDIDMETPIIFVDLKKASDTINRTKLLEILQNDNILQ